VSGGGCYVEIFDARRSLDCALLGELLPDEVTSDEAFCDLPGAWLFPDEQAAVARSVDRRRREFASVRSCARRSLIQLGLPPTAIVPGDRGSPQWPPGVVGSMTHCAGYRGAALAHSRDVTAIGIDAEPHDRLPDGVLDLIALPDELTWVTALRAKMPDVNWGRLLFCAKESVYKAWFPLTHQWLGFEDVRISVDAASKTFRGQLLVAGPILGGRALSMLTGRWLVRHELVLAVRARI